MTLKKIIMGLALIGIAFLINAFEMRDSLFVRDAPAKDLNGKIDSVLQLMTLEEKIGQMTLFSSGWDITGPTMREEYQEDIKAGKVGAVFNAHTARFTRELQRMAVEETRLGIPLLFGYDIIHGYKTVFPIPLGESASWDLEAIERAARIAAVEGSAAGLHWTFAPMVDVSRDPRWGRVAEGAGEDPFLGSQIARARVRGFQGEDIHATNTVLACAKHYAAYGAAQAGRDYHTVDMSERRLREIYLPPFLAAKEEGVHTFMTAFNELNGVPATGNNFLLDQILRDEWGFEGFVVTDYTSINEMVPHGIVANEKQAGELALNAGVDMDMQGAVFYNHLAESVKEGAVTEAQIDQAVRRILRMKFELGLFEDPYRYCDEELQKATLMKEEHLEAARDMARRSMVLLKNDNQTLPFSRDIETLAVIGPLADNQRELIGSWSGAGDYKMSVTLLTGIEEKLGDEVEILHAKGCEIDGADRSGFEAALLAATAAEAVILAVGERANMSGEAASRAKLSLPGVQTELVEAVAAIGKPTAVVLMNGRPLCIPEVDETAPAILETWFAGVMAGPAIADVLFGDYNPSGKLPMTFPRHEGQIPIFYNLKNTGRPMDPNNKYTSKYLDMPNTPLYPFGHGLSYTTFEYSGLKLERETFSEGEPLTIRVTVTNAGDRDGEEVVQLYVRDLVGSVTRPLQELKDFRKVSLASGASREVAFTLRTDDLKFYTRDMEYAAEPGRYEIMVGSSSAQTQSVQVEMVEN